MGKTKKRVDSSKSSMNALKCVVVGDGTVGSKRAFVKLTFKVT